MKNSGVGAANQLLAGLPHSDYRRLFPHLESIVLSFAEVLAEHKATPRHVYFPTSGLIAIHTPTVGRTSLVLVGSEGMVGSAIAAGVTASDSLVMVQGAGVAMRMGARQFRLLAERSSTLQRQVHRYTLRLLRCASQIAVCNGVHRTGARLARCLLEASDRGQTPDLQITQDILADLIGAQRTSVSIAAAAMRRRKLIAYARGRLQITNRRGLLKLACPCYVKQPLSQR